MLMPADIDLYWRIRNDPYKCNGLRREDAMVHCIDHEREFARLDAGTRFILQAEAAGFTRNEMAKMCDVSARTMDRRMAEFRAQRRWDV